MNTHIGADRSGVLPLTRLVLTQSVVNRLLQPVKHRSSGACLPMEVWWTRLRITLHPNPPVLPCGKPRIRCRIHHTSRGREAPEDLRLTGSSSQFTTDWDNTNLVRGKSPDQSDRSTLTSQTGLSRGRPKFVQFAKNIVLKKRRMNQCQCKLILRRFQLQRLCKSGTEGAKLKVHKKDR